MKKFLLSLALLLGLCAQASAQGCIAVGGVNSVPQTGVVCQSEPTTDTYAATGVGIAPASTATDVACITGSATKVVRLQRIRVSGTAGTLITVPVLITKHASANTGGTAATGTALPVPYPLDSTDATVSATTTAYTANPTITDSTPGIIAAATLSLNTTSALVGQGEVALDWASRNYMEAPTLRGIAQQLCVNLNATSPSSGLVNVTFVWTEAAQ